MKSCEEQMELPLDKCILISEDIMETQDPAHQNEIETCPVTDEETFAEGAQESCQNEDEHRSGKSEKDHKSKPSREHQAFYDRFAQELAQLNDIEAKLKHTIDYMESSLSQNGSPSFKFFWDIRKMCLDLFKEDSLSPTSRVRFWNKYIELSQEARRLKEILDEQSAFAAEQIEMAITALENDIKQIPEVLNNGQPLNFDISAQIIEKKRSYYGSIQKELNLLNAYASRINALRKELIKTDMRIRQKNKFFQRLSSAGDLVFPKRKDLIRDVSQQFMDDVESFIKSEFKENDIPHTLFALREEIKSLQGVAKILTLNTLAFTHTRMRLSECWDKIKHFEKERKKERILQKTQFKQQADEVAQKIDEIKELVKDGKFSISEVQARLDDTISFMRNQTLGRDEIKALRDEISGIKKIVYDKQKADEDEKHAVEREREKVRRSKIEEIKQKIENLFNDAQKLNVEQLESTRNSILEEIQVTNLGKQEKAELEKLLKPLRDVISDKKSDSLSDDAKQAISQLKVLLQEKQERRSEINSQLEIYRKASGSSGLDFQKAFEYQEQIKSEKQLLDKIDESIVEIKQKIRKLESQNP
jgi:hypothetical protein